MRKVIASSSNSSNSKAADSAPLADSGDPTTQMPDLHSCRFHIEQVVRTIEPPEIKEIVEPVFNSLLRLLECLSFIERYLRQVATAEETLALFQLIRDEAEVLVEFIREEGLNSPAMNDELIDILDGITFAVSHDIRRVFEPDQRTGASQKSTHTVVGKLYRAHDLLTNCLQQSTVTLAMVFQPDLVGTKLFNNSDLRFRQSLQLCDDLTDLLQLIASCEGDRDQSALSNLSEGVERFRNQSLECLMYSDWSQFEGFCESIKGAESSEAEFQAVLHQFRCYLETLLGQVKMRAVLADVFPSQYGSELGGSVEGSQITSTVHDQNEPAGRDPFAIAV